MKSRIKVPWVHLFGIIAIAAVIATTMTACSAGNKAGRALKEYEKFLDDFESLVKKMKAGDAAAQADLEKLEARVGEWSDRWDGISENDFTLMQKAKLATLSLRAAAIMADYAMYQYRQ